MTFFSIYSTHILSTDTTSILIRIFSLGNYYAEYAIHFILFKWGTLLGSYIFVSYTKLSVDEYISVLYYVILVIFNTTIALPAFNSSIESTVPVYNMQHLSYVLYIYAICVAVIIMTHGQVCKYTGYSQMVCIFILVSFTCLFDVYACVL